MLRRPNVKPPPPMSKEIFSVDACVRVNSSTTSHLLANRRILIMLIVLVVSFQLYYYGVVTNHIQDAASDGDKIDYINKHVKAVSPHKKNKDNSKNVTNDNVSVPTANTTILINNSIDRTHRNVTERNCPRIVVLAGPHKAASTTLQNFFIGIASLTVPLTNDTSEFKKPHPAITEWVWPDGKRNDIRSIGLTNRKQFAHLLRVIWKFNEHDSVINWSGKTEAQIDEIREKGIDYFRFLFRRPWADGKKIVIGSEEVDRLVHGLLTKSSGPDVGEETHVSPHSSNMIDALLNVFPWDNATSTPAAFQETNGIIRTPSLRLEDIEFQINYRTPRIDQVVSVWREVGNAGDQNSTLQQMLTSRSDRHYHLSTTNSLALALQLVRKNIKTTIVDMRGVSEKESRESTNKATTGKGLVGGIEGVVACDILRMPKIMCDKNSRLHLPGYKARGRSNKRKDTTVRNLTDGQMEEINVAFEQYDCGVWKHLQKYQDKGLLRILYPSERLFETCDPKISKNISFISLLENVKIIAKKTAPLSN